MTEEVRLGLAFASALATTWLTVPFAIRVATATGFFDHPRGYKHHLRSTPYLGGMAVIAGFTLAGAAFAWDLPRFAPLTACALVLLAVGTLDDRVGLPVAPRLAVQIAAAVALWATGLGWNMLPGDSADLALTIVWVVGLINAFNLMDNLDGAATSVAAACAGGAAVLALIQGAVGLAALALALGGACIGFLPHNLARPSRIFLGDGGSMPIGLLVAGVIMAVPDGVLDWATLLASAPLVGLPILDTALVVVSRLRRGHRVLSGARDHLTHRLLVRLHSERRVALTLAGIQLALCGLAIALHELTQAGVVVGASAAVLAGLAALAVLETERWMPPAAGPSP